MLILGLLKLFILIKESEYPSPIGEPQSNLQQITCPDKYCVLYHCCFTFYRSRRFDSVFASADEVGQLYQVQETPRERKQRMWEEKRSETSSHRRSGHRGRGRGRNRHHAGGVVGGKSTRQNKFVKSDRGHFKSHRTGKRDSRKR